jgi:hypothetical protein
MNPATDDSLADAILRQLTTNAARAAFVAELRLLAPGADQDAAFERSLDALERAGRVLVRAHACADPHMRLVDLRIAALIEPGDPAGPDPGGTDPLNEAVKRDQSLWGEWITEFLRDHRCAG